jgi:hypothetical protein
LALSSLNIQGGTSGQEDWQVLRPLPFLRGGRFGVQKAGQKAWRRVSKGRQGSGQGLHPLQPWGPE